MRNMKRLLFISSVSLRLRIVRRKFPCLLIQNHWCPAIRWLVKGPTSFASVKQDRSEETSAILLVYVSAFSLSGSCGDEKAGCRLAY